MALRTLERMADGGIHDQLGGGFHRYAVDAIWLVPHFEQMLYDNALLARAYLAAWQVTGDEQLARGRRGHPRLPAARARARARRLRLGAGRRHRRRRGRDLHVDARAAARRARRRGRRARRAHLGRHRRRATSRARRCSRWSLAPEDDGGARRASRACARSCSRRAPRVRSRRSTTRRSRAGTAWRWRRWPRARASAGGPTCWRPPSAAPPSCSARCRTPTAGSGARTAPAAARCRASWTTTRRSPLGLHELYLATREHRYLDESRRLALLACERFGAPDGSFFDTAHDAEVLVARPRELDDNPTPSGNSTLAGLLVRLARTYGEPELERRAQAVVDQVGTLLARAPQGFGHLLGVCDALLAPPREAAVVGAPRTIPRRPSSPRRCSLPTSRISPSRSATGATTWACRCSRGAVSSAGRPAVYVCSGFVCAAPATDAHMVRTALLNANPT